MPNQRAKNKVYLGGYIDRQLEKRIVSLAARSGMAHNKFGFAVQLIEESLRRRSGKRTQQEAPFKSVSASVAKKKLSPKKDRQVR